MNNLNIKSLHRHLKEGSGSNEATGGGADERRESLAVARLGQQETK